MPRTEVSSITNERYALVILKREDGVYDFVSQWREGDGWSRRREEYARLDDARQAMYQRADWCHANPR